MATRLHICIVSFVGLRQYTFNRVNILSLSRITSGKLLCINRIYSHKYGIVNCKISFCIHYYGTGRNISQPLAFGVNCKCNNHRNTKYARNNAIAYKINTS